MTQTQAEMKKDDKAAAKKAVAEAVLAQGINRGNGVVVVFPGHDGGGHPHKQMRRHCTTIQGSVAGESWGVPLCSFEYRRILLPAHWTNSEPPEEQA